MQSLLAQAISTVPVKCALLPLSGALHFPWSDNVSYFRFWMNGGRFKGDSTHPLHLKVTFLLMVPHSSEFSPPSLCPRGRAHTSVCHFIQRGQAPWATASNSVRSQKAVPNHST